MKSERIKSDRGASPVGWLLDELIEGRQRVDNIEFASSRGRLAGWLLSGRNVDWIRDGVRATLIRRVSFIMGSNSSLPSSLFSLRSGEETSSLFV